MTARPVKICVVTGARSEYGLLQPLLKLLAADKHFSLQLLVTGMHLSPEFGLTYQQIEQEGFTITERVEMLLSADTPTAVVKSTGLGMIGYADAFDRLKPDAVVVLGDRFETFAAATAAYLKKIPLVHLHGGEITVGATDEALRHAITKMAALHFTSTEAHRKRVLQLGEKETTVFNVGAIGVDSIKNLPLLSRAELQQQLGLVLTDPVFLVTYHPVTLEHATGEEQLHALLAALDAFGKGQVIFTLPNADAGGRILIDVIQAYVKKSSGKAAAFTSLGQVRYLSLMKAAAVVIGNSSSGIIEAPSFGIPSIDIGDRQRGREAADSVIRCSAQTEAITAALTKAMDKSFRQRCAGVKNPYGDGDAADKIMSVLKNNLHTINLKKEFVDRI